MRELQKLVDTRPYLRAAQLDPAAATPLAPAGAFDTVLLQNAVERVEDDVAVMHRVFAALAPGGRALVLAPHGRSLFGSLDGVLGHLRRYSRANLVRLGEAAGFRVQVVKPFNRCSSLVWFVNARLLRRRRFSVLKVKLLNLLVPLLRRLEWLPLPPLTLLAVFEKPVTPADAPVALSS